MNILPLQKESKFKSGGSISRLSDEMLYRTMKLRTGETSKFCLKPECWIFICFIYLLFDIVNTKHKKFSRGMQRDFIESEAH